MNREIKFRGRDAKGVWHFGDLAHSQAVTETGLQPRVTVGGYEVDEETVGQYWRTINGNDLFDGDIISLEIDECQVTYVVGYIEYSIKIANINELSLKYISPWAFLKEDWWNDFEDNISIIGNKFDNPELLK